MARPKAGREWQFLLALAIAIWLAMNAGAAVNSLGNIRNTMTDNQPRPSDETAAAPSTVGNLRFEVKSLRALPSRDNSGDLTVNVTLEVDNAGTADVAFDPSRFSLRGNSGQAFSPQLSTKSPIEVAPDSSQLTPLTFDLPTSQQGPYRLSYGDRQIFSGYSA